MAINNYIYSLNDLKNTTWTFYKNNFQDVAVDVEFWYGENHIELNVFGNDGFCEIIDNSGNHYTNCVDFILTFTSNTHHILTNFDVYIYNKDAGQSEIIALTELPKTITFNERVVNLDTGGAPQSELLSQLLAFLDTSSILIKKWNFGDIFNAKEELSRIEYNTIKLKPADFIIYDCSDEINEYTSYVNYNSITSNGNTLRVGYIIKNGNNYAIITSFSNEINPNNISMYVSAGLIPGMQQTGQEYVLISNQTGTNIYIKEIKNSIANDGIKNEWLDNTTRNKNYTNMFLPELLNYGDDVELIYSINSIDYTKTTKGQILSSYSSEIQQNDNIASIADETYDYVNVRYLSSTKNILTFKTDWQYEDIPTLEDISRILGNINAISQILEVPITLTYQNPLTSTFLNSVENALETIAKKLKEG